ncbi:efflux RND transporter periplasmic adaptor subunit [Pendulispora albinea]|uniref:Efflux RND transporter periplasmic adaptor subunit n=1 Tax=Pendulispora albinea TaxID=2741071 RepID=A0ABZ2MAV7_9BACT
MKNPAALVLCITLGLIPALDGCRGNKEPAGDSKKEAPRIAVDTAPVIERPMPDILPLTGTLQAELRSELTANASGRVVKTFVERGQKISLNAPLAQLDIRTAKVGLQQANASVAQVKTQLDSADAECARYDALLARGAITRQEYDKQSAECKQQRAALVVSQAKVAEAAITVGDGTIRAPFAGVVAERSVSVGDYVQPSSKVATLVVGDPLRLNLTVPEPRIAMVKEGQIVTFSAAAVPGKTFTGAVRYRSGEVRQTTRDLIVEAVVPNPDGELLPGMFVNVSLRLGEKPALVVPKSAVFATGNEKSVFVVKDGRLGLRIIKVGVEQGDVVEAENGVAKDEPVVLHPADTMSDGDRVK